MAKVLQFPVKKHLSPEIEDCLYEIGKAYLEILNYALTKLSIDDPDQRELDEIRDLVVYAYAEGLERALEDMEKEL